MKLLSTIKRNKIKSALLFTVFFNILFIHFYLPRIFIEPNNFVVQLLNGKPVKKSPTAYGLNYQKIMITTEDKLTLKGYKIYSNTSANKGTIILLHGIRSYKEHFLELSKTLADNGYNAVLIDLRGHGESGGKYCTFGFYEKQDISILIDEIIKDNQLSPNIGVWGQSLGGAIALQTMAIDNRIQFGIVESTFSDLNQVSKEYLARITGIKNQWIADYLMWRISAIANFKSNEVQPRESAKKITQPILLVHGTVDERINNYHAIINFENIKSDKKQLLQIKGANHINVWIVGGEKYLNRVLKFIGNANNEN